MNPPTAQDPLPDAPLELAGQWIAWSDDRTRIVANGRSLAEVYSAAQSTGQKHPLFEKVLRPDRRYVGRP
jgi:hypothetical protein